MTGAYVRIQRNGEWKSVELEKLSNEERERIFMDRSKAELLRWLNMCCFRLDEAERQIIDLKEYFQQVRNDIPENDDKLTELSEN